MKLIKGYENFYSIEENGDIWSKRKNTLLKPWKGSHGYMVVALYKEPGVSKKYLVHRLVAEAFVVNPENLPEVNHRNGITTDNRSENLEWVTSAENKEHARLNGLYKKGEKHPSSKLTDRKVHFIHELNKLNIFSQSELGEIFDVSQALISSVIKGKRWKR